MNLFEVLKPFEKEEDANKKKAILENIIKQFDRSDWYTHFGLAKNHLINSGITELNQAFRNLSLKIHPDRIGKNLPYHEAAEALFKKVTDARDQIIKDIETEKTKTQQQNKTSQKQYNNNNNNNNNNNRKSKNQSKNSSNFNPDNTQFNQHPHVSPYYYYYHNLFHNPGFFNAEGFYKTNFTNVPPNFNPYPPNMNPGGTPSFFQPSPSTNIAPTIFDEIAKNHIKTHKLDGKLIVNGSVHGQLICTHLGEVHILGQVTGKVVAKRANVIVQGVVTGDIKSEHGSITIMDNVSGNIANVHGNNTINGDLLVQGSVTNQKGWNTITGQALGKINNITGNNYYNANVSDGHRSDQNNSNFSM